MEYGIIRGLCWFRIFAAMWTCLVVAISYSKLIYPSYAIMACAALLIISVLIKQLANKNPALLMKPEVVLADLGLSVLITILGGFVYEHGSTSNTLAFGSQYILASVLMVGVAFGMYGGIIGGVAIGLSRVGAALVNHADLYKTNQMLSFVSTTVTFSLAGALVGGIVQVIRKAGGELSEARARDSIARTLHDGVLQTLVIIERKSKDKEIQTLAQSQEKELRSFLFTHQSNSSNTTISIHNALEDIVSDVSNKYDLPVSIAIAPDLNHLPKNSIRALSGAVKECVSNAAKHSKAKSISIYAEPEEDFFIITVRDDGVGFDAEKILKNEDQQNQKRGLRSSVIGRIEEIGGQVNIKSNKTSGTEIEIKIPTTSKVNK